MIQEAMPLSPCFGLNTHEQVGNVGEVDEHVMQVGLMHFLSGERSAADVLVKESALMAIAEINQSGGVLGKIVEPVVVDLGSGSSHLAQAQALMEELGVRYLFGGGSSSNRHSIIPILEKYQGQLWYPYVHEGLECSKHVFYAGACPNQVVQPAVNWLLHHRGKRVYLVGTEGVYSRVVSKIIRAQIKQSYGLLLCEDTLGTDHSHSSRGSHFSKLQTEFKNYREAIAKIKITAPDVIISTLSMRDALAFSRHYVASGLKIPILFLRLSEVELGQLPSHEVAMMAGHLLCANYFQCLDLEANQQFLQKAKIWFGSHGDRPLLMNAAMQAAYSQMFWWKQSVETAQSLDVNVVAKAARQQVWMSAAGTMICDQGHHVQTGCHIAEIQSSGLLKIIHSVEAIPPLPWFGAENLDAKSNFVIKELLADISRDAQHSWQLERDAQDLEDTISQLLGRGAEKGRNQLAPEITRAAMSKLFKANQRLLKAQSDLLNVEAALREANELLEQRIEQRTLQLQKTIKRLQNEAADRQQAETLLHESQRRFAAIADNIPGVVYRAVMHTDGAVSMPYLSPRTKEIFGISVDEFYEHLEWVFDMAHPEDRQALNEMVKKSAEELRFFEHEYRVSSLFEKVKWVRIISQPHLNEYGDTVWDGVIIDISHQKEIEESLRQAEEKYRSIFENAIEGIFQAQPNGCYVNSNPALAAIYGYDSCDELLAGVAADPEHLFVDVERHQEFLRQIMSQGAVTGFETKVYRCDRSQIWILINATANYDLQGNFIGYEGIVQDITERKQAEQALQAEQEKSENLLLNILPQAIVKQLKSGSNAIASRSDNVTILFADIVDFTTLSTQVTPGELVSMLNEIFSSFDMLADQLGLEKIKTIGDAYMVVGGLPTPRDDHAEAIAEMAIAMQGVITKFKRDEQESFRLRIGINTGSVVAGVIGIRKFIYDLWGDAVNLASRMESHGIAGGIQVTESTYNLLKNNYSFWHRGKVFIKGRGEMDTYMLLNRLPSAETSMHVEQVTEFVTTA
ncbi:MAG: transporter substrate-binding protein [Pseudanabaenaceae cyanobacterium bins.39]|nr:transporter substrate-binding protein [Pseudanabaenaceae cyanobacterium bins.39]